MSSSTDDQLANSCGQIRPISLVASLHRGKKPTRYLIQKPYAIIGRHPQCDVLLPYPDVSNQHVYLQVLDGRLFCVDQESRKWVYWKDKPRLYGWLDAGEWIQVGPYRITLEQPVGASNCRAAHAPNTKPFLSRYKSEAATEGQLLLNDQHVISLQSQLTTIGRSKYCNLELEEDSVSRVHASIVRTLDGHCWIIDLKSRLGIKVNGERCQAALLKDQDNICIGSYSLTFHVVPKDSVNKPIRQARFADLPAPALLEGIASEPADKSSETASPPSSRLLQSEEPSRLPANMVLYDKQPVAQVLPSLEEKASAELVPSYSSALVKPATSTFIAPHVKLPRNAARLPQTPRRPVAAEDMGLMEGMMQYMKQMQQEMMAQMRMNMDMMAEFMGTMQKQQMEVIRQELAEFSKLNKELLELRQSLLTTVPVAQVVKQPPVPGNTHVSSTRKAGKVERPIQEKQPSLSSDPTVDEDVSLNSHVWITKRIATLESERQSRWEKMKSAMMGK